MSKHAPNSSEISKPHVPSGGGERHVDLYSFGADGERVDKQREVARESENPALFSFLDRWFSKEK